MPRTPDRLGGYSVLREEEAADRGLGAYLQLDDNEAPLTVEWDESRIRISETQTVTVSGNTAFVVTDNATTYFWVDDEGTVQTSTSGYPSSGAIFLMGRVVASNGAIVSISHDLTPYASGRYYDNRRTLAQWADAGGPISSDLPYVLEETLPANALFPTSSTWWETDDEFTKVRKVLKVTVTWDGIYPSTSTWELYAADGSTVLETLSETYDYSGGNTYTPKVKRSFG